MIRKMRPANYRRMRFEQLEDRRVLSAVLLEDLGFSGSGPQELIPDNEGGIWFFGSNPTSFRNVDRSGNVIQDLPLQDVYTMVGGAGFGIEDFQVDEAGKLYILDYSFERVIVFDASLGFESKWDICKDVTCQEIFDIQVDDNYVYILSTASTSNSRWSDIHKYQKNGVFEDNVRLFTESGSSTYREEIDEMRLAPDGSIWVLGRHRIVGNSSYYDGRFYHVLPDGNIEVHAVKDAHPSMVGDVRINAFSIDGEGNIWAMAGNSTPERFGYNGLYKIAPTVDSAELIFRGPGLNDIGALDSRGNLFVIGSPRYCGDPQASGGIIRGFVPGVANEDVNLDFLRICETELDIDNGHRLVVDSSVTLDPTGTLNVTSSELVFDTLDAADKSAISLSNATVSGSRFTLNGSALVTGSGTITSRFLGDGNSSIVANGGLAIGNAVEPDGFATAGMIEVGDGSVLTLASGGYARVANTILADGEIVAANGLILSAGSTISGSGAIRGRLAQQMGSSVRLGNNLTIGDEESYAGFFSDGELVIEEHTATLQDKDWSVLGSLTSLGTQTSNGILAAANGLLLEEGKVLKGRGTIETTNDIFKNQGLVAAEDGTITFENDVSGRGRFVGNIQFNADYSPGNSPGLGRIDGNLTLTESSTLTFEIEGTNRGSQYDGIDVSGDSQLNGDLVIAVDDGFSPAEDDSFHVISTGFYSGDFDEYRNLDLTETLTLWPQWKGNDLYLETLDKYPWHNYANAFDVNEDSVVTPLDALWTINYLNIEGIGDLPWPRDKGKEAPFYDVNRDGVTAPMDVLFVINYLNRNVGNAEGEFAEKSESEIFYFPLSRQVPRAVIAKTDASDPVCRDIVFNDLGADNSYRPSTDNGGVSTLQTDLRKDYHGVGEQTLEDIFTVLGVTSWSEV